MDRRPLKRKVLRKGVEPDECFYVEHEREARGKKRLDLRRHPPPDLVIEVDVSWSIYAALKVPEIWSYDDGEVK